MTDKELYKIIGEKISRIRETNNVTLETLGRFVGVSGQQVQKYEVGQSRLPLSSCYKILIYFNINPDEFFKEVHEVMIKDK